MQGAVEVLPRHRWLTLQFIECSGLAPCSLGLPGPSAGSHWLLFPLVPALANQPILFHKLLGLPSLRGVCGDLSVAEQLAELICSPGFCPRHTQ